MLIPNSAAKLITLSPAWAALDKYPPSDLVIKTPLIRSTALAEAAGLDEVWFKAEYLQTGGSFKVRGALHKLRALLYLKQRPNVYTASAGNHGIGLAIAARELGFTAIIYVPTTTPEVKRQKIRSAGAILEVAGDNYDESEALAIEACNAAKGEYVSSFDDDYIISGNGASIAREIHSDIGTRLKEFDILIPIGGGGLAAGIGAQLTGNTQNIIGVEPETNCAMAFSFENGQYCEEYAGKSSKADGLAGAISEQTFNICNQTVSKILTVTEEEIIQAISWAYNNLGIVIEGSAAVTIAALLSRKNIFSKKVCLVLTGANIDQNSLRDSIQL